MAFQNESEDHFTLDTHGATSSSGNLSLLDIIGIGVSAAGKLPLDGLPSCPFGIQ